MQIISLHEILNLLLQLLANCIYSRYLWFLRAAISKFLTFFVHTSLMPLWFGNFFVFDLLRWFDFLVCFSICQFRVCGRWLTNCIIRSQQFFFYISVWFFLYFLNRSMIMIKPKKSFKCSVCAPFEKALYSSILYVLHMIMFRFRSTSFHFIYVTFHISYL